MQKFKYIIINNSNSKITLQQYENILNDILKHNEKHDFAQMIFKKEIKLEDIKIQDISYHAISIPFQKERFEDLTALNWYIKTLCQKHQLKLFQLMLPDGSLIGT